MEKRTPHCKLTAVKALVEANKVRARSSIPKERAPANAEAVDGICAVLLALEPRHFYKSMTTHADHRIWQDVYYASTQAGDGVYIKLTVIEDVLIVSFKEL